MTELLAALRVEAPEAPNVSFTQTDFSAAALRLGIPNAVQVAADAHSIHEAGLRRNPALMSQTRELLKEGPYRTALRLLPRLLSEILRYDAELIESGPETGVNHEEPERDFARFQSEDPAAIYAATTALSAVGILRDEADVARLRSVAAGVDEERSLVGQDPDINPAEVVLAEESAPVVVVESVATTTTGRERVRRVGASAVRGARRDSGTVVSYAIQPVDHALGPVTVVTNYGSMPIQRPTAIISGEIPPSAHNGTDDWKDGAICRETDPEAFFPEKGGSTREAKQVCAECPVRPECLNYALANDEPFGIWGGLSERQRRKLKMNGVTAVELPSPTAEQPEGHPEPQRLRRDSQPQEVAVIERPKPTKPKARRHREVSSKTQDAPRVNVASIMEGMPDDPKYYETIRRKFGWRITANSLSVKQRIACYRLHQQGHGVVAIARVLDVKVYTVNNALRSCDAHSPELTKLLLLGSDARSAEE